jgi:hypothetical protein
MAQTLAGRTKKQIRNVLSFDERLGIALAMGKTSEIWRHQ